MKLSCARWICAAMICTVAHTAAAAPRFRVTTLLPDAPYLMADPAAINNAGQVVGAAYRSDGSAGFFWSAAEGWREIQPTDGLAWAFAEDINNVGQVVVTSKPDARFDGGYRSYVWTPDGAFETIADLRQRMPDTRGVAINDAGVVVGYAIAGGPALRWHAFSWTHAAGTVDLQLSMSQHRAADVNNAGVIVGLADPWWHNPFAVVRDVDGSVHRLTHHKFDYGSAEAINDLGDIIGNDGVHAFLCRTADRHRRFLQAPPGFAHLWLTGINNATQIVGYAWVSPFGPFVGMLWTHKDGAIDLNQLLDPSDPLHGRVVVAQAYAINDHGVIAGWGTVDGQNVGLVLTPTPPD